MVADPQLAAHLAHFGIDAAANSQPTARSVAGLGLDARAHFHSVLSQWIRVRVGSRRPPQRLPTACDSAATATPHKPNALPAPLYTSPGGGTPCKADRTQSFTCLPDSNSPVRNRTPNQVPEDSVGPMFASFHPMAQDMLIQEYRRQMRAYHALQRRLAGCGSSGTGAGGGWRPPRRGEPDAPGGPEADHLGLERDAAAADQEALYAEMPLEELEEVRGETRLVRLLHTTFCPHRLCRDSLRLRLFGWLELKSGLRVRRAEGEQRAAGLPSQSSMMRNPAPVFCVGMSPWLGR